MSENVQHRTMML